MKQEKPVGPGEADLCGAAGRVTQIIYVDDSGDEDRDLLVALIIPLTRWTECLKVWLNWRRFLFRQWGIPADFELHAEQFLKPDKNQVPANHARSHKTTASGINSAIGQRKEVYRRSLETVRYIPNARILGVYELGTDRLQTYQRLLTALDALLKASEDCGIIMVDGFDSRLRGEHRKLKIDDRAVYEDPWHEDSAHSQFLQTADLAVHAAYQHIAQHQNRRFMWDWYGAQMSKAIVDLSGACACGIEGH